MANYTTVYDLIADALFRADEATDGTSDYASKVVEYLNAVQHALLLGGGVGVRDLATSAGIYSYLVQLPITDWWWARKQPRGVITTTAAITTGTVTATQGSTSITFSNAPADSVAGRRIRIAGLPTVPRIESHTAASTSATLDAAWPEETQTTQSYVVFETEYDLPSDFLRFAGPPVLHASGAEPIAVSSREVLETNFPISEITAGYPTRAAMITPTRIQLNRYKDRAYRLEFDYIYLPADLSAGLNEPILPRHHRRVLSTGAASLICHDKNDTKQKTLASEFREHVSLLVQEHRKQLSSGSQTIGQFRVRSPGRPRLMTESGTILL